MTSLTVDRIPAEWVKGMQRAQSRGLKATLTATGSYRVHSGSRAGRDYRIDVVAGKLGPCQCEAMDHYGETFVCAHRGAAAIAFFALHNVAIEPASVPAPSARVMSMEEWAAIHIHGPIFRPEPEYGYEGAGA